MTCTDSRMTCPCTDCVEARSRLRWYGDGRGPHKISCDGNRTRNPALTNVVRDFDISKCNCGILKRAQFGGADVATLFSKWVDEAACAEVHGS